MSQFSVKVPLMQDPGPSADIRVHPSATSVVRFGRFFFDRDNHILSTENGEITLPPRVLAILDLLVERAGSVVSKETLMGEVWKDAYVGDTSLTEAVSLLRQALDDDPKSPSYIQTVHRRGYRFVATVTVAGRAAGPAKFEADQSPPRGHDQPRQSLFARPVVRLGLVAVGVIIIAGALTFFPRTPEVDPTNTAAIRLDVSYPQGVIHPMFGASVLALSPDGDVLVFVGLDSDGETRLYRRRISEFESYVLPGTEDAGSPFFSPDGKWVAFFAGGEIRKTPLNGGAVIRVCASTFAFGGTWTDDGSIISTAGYPSGLTIVSADGGEVRDLTSLRPASGEIGHWWPQILPGGRGVLYTIWSSALETARVAVLDLESGEERILIEGASYPRYSARGDILYVTPGGLTSVPFDIDNLAVAGPSREMVDQPSAIEFTGVAHFALADNGTLAYLPSNADSRDFALVLIDSDGAEEPIGLEPGLFRNLRVDPKGETVAVTILDGSRSDVWTTSLTSPNLNRLTFSGFNIEPRWSPDGRWIVFASNRDGPFNIYRKPAGGGGVAERLAVSGLHQYPAAFTPDAKLLIYSQTDPVTGFDIWAMGFGDDETPATPLIRTPANEYMPSLSPDGRWMAYLSDETGRWDVYLRSMAGDGGVWQVSRGGAGEPFWSVDGTKLYFGRKDGLDLVPVISEPELSLGQRSTFAWPDALGAVDSLPNGREFVVIKQLDERPQIDAVRVVVKPD
jgi:serine/threonine-protein kinase